MADFLTRLVQRTLGLASVVQPRIASPYAPAAEVITASDDAFSSSSNVRASSEPPPEPFATTLTSTNVYIDQTLRSAAPGASPLPLIAPLSNPEETSSLTTPETSSQTTLHSSLRMGNNPSVTSIELPPTSSLEAPQNHSEPLPAFSQLPFPPITNSSENRSVPLLPQQSLESQVAPSTDEIKPQQLSSSSNLGKNSSSSPPSLNQPELKPQASAVRLPIAPPAIPHSSLPLVNQQNRIPPGLVSTQTPLVSSSSAITQPINQPEPLIEVRIGRIEVRRIQPATAQPRPRSTPSAPALSLSDYLNQREGGKP